MRKVCIDLDNGIEAETVWNYLNKRAPFTNPTQTGKTVCIDVEDSMTIDNLEDTVDWDADILRNFAQKLREEL